MCFVFGVSYPFFSPGIILVISEGPYEIVNLFNPKKKYGLKVGGQYVPSVGLSVGGILQKSPIICGGFANGWIMKNCFVIGQPRLEMNMDIQRQAAASCVLSNDTLWVVGGETGISQGSVSLRSTEFIKLGYPSLKGPDMPFTINRHCMIQYDDESIYIIGGNQNSLHCSKKTWIVNPKNGFQIREGPSLNVERMNHACAKMTINGRTKLVVTGGYIKSSGEYLDSVEILDPLPDVFGVCYGWTQGL